MQYFKMKNRYFYMGVVVFLTVSAILAFYDTFFGDSMLVRYIGSIFRVFKPVVWGLAIAYILAPVVNFIERKILRPVALEGQRKRKQKSWVRVTSVLMTLALMVFLFSIVMNLLVPQVVQSIMQIIENLGGYIETLNGWIANLSKYDDKVSSDLTVMINTAYQNLSEWLSRQMSTSTKDIIETLSSSVFSIFMFGKNLLLGIIVAAYILGMKEKLGAQGKKILYGVLNGDMAQKTLDALDYANRIFGGFIRGKLLDSLIIGIICFVGCSILGIPFAPLVSVVVGITNIIPFFGPFIGAIPCCILIVLIDPIKCLIFILFILALQQFDGNILGPKILGDSTGLESLWVIIAIIVGGAIAGPMGMLLGCPIFALFYAAFRHFVNNSLQRKNLPTQTDEYRGKTPPGSIDVVENDKHCD